MKIVTISDIHGNLVEKMPDGDILVIAGDICPATNHQIQYQAEWLERRFNLWLESLNYDHIVCIAGNHDFVFEKAPELVPKLKCHYLQESSVVIEGLKFYGHPYTPWFHDWAWNRYYDQLIEINEKIPDDTNVLITHGPPYGILDVLKDPYRTKENLGCKALRERIDQLPDLKLSVFGHLHSAEGILKIGDTTFINASYLDESYSPTYAPKVIDL
jgi:Icc-related predicted phosphoesterase